MGRMKKLIATGALTGLLCSLALAEAWPTLVEYVRKCVLIVKCRTEAHGDTFKYRVLETWKGKYSPELFSTEPPDGYILTNTWHGNDSPDVGREVIFFFTPNTVTDKLLAHSTCFVIEQGKLVYASTSENGLRKEYTVKEFKKAILKIVDRQRRDEAEPKRAANSRPFRVLAVRPELDFYIVDSPKGELGVGQIYRVYDRQILVGHLKVTQAIGSRFTIEGVRREVKDLLKPGYRYELIRDP